jgi:hypothetical protein
MSTTRDYKTTVNERVQAEPGFAASLLNEAVTLFLNGEPDTARLTLQDLVNTVKDQAEDPLLQLAGAFSCDVKNVGTNHDIHIGQELGNAHE